MKSKQVNIKEFLRSTAKKKVLQKASPWQYIAGMKSFRAPVQQIQKCSADLDEITVILRHFPRLLSIQTPVKSLIEFKNLTDLCQSEKVIHL